MNSITPFTDDLIYTFRCLKKEDQVDLLKYVRDRYAGSLKNNESYRKKALAQIRSALNH